MLTCHQKLFKSRKLCGISLLYTLFWILSFYRVWFKRKSSNCSSKCIASSFFPYDLTGCPKPPICHFYILISRWVREKEQKRWGNGLLLLQVQKSVVSNRKCSIILLLDLNNGCVALGYWSLGFQWDTKMLDQLQGSRPDLSCITERVVGGHRIPSFDPSSPLWNEIQNLGQELLGGFRLDIKSLLVERRSSLSFQVHFFSNIYFSPFSFLFLYIH